MTRNYQPTHTTFTTRVLSAILFLISGCGASSPLPPLPTACAPLAQAVYGAPWWQCGSLTCQRPRFSPQSTETRCDVECYEKNGNDFKLSGLIINVKPHDLGVMGTYRAQPLYCTPQPQML